MRISLFGNLRIDAGGKPVTSVNTNRLQSLIAWLILHSDTPQPRDRLAFTLWPASRESQARTNLRQLLHNLKRAIPAECDALAIDHFAIQWQRNGSCTVDVFELQSALADAAAARSGNDRATEIRCLTTAAQLYEDDLLPSLYDDWLVPLREEFRNRICDALHRLATLLEERKEYAAAIQYCNRLLVLDPLNEHHHQLLIRLHAANQDRASALRAYHQCMRVLRREMGVEPGPVTRELFERILKGQITEPAKRGTVAASAWRGNLGRRTGTPSGTRSPGSSNSAEGPDLLQKAPAIVGRNSEWSLLTQAWQTAVENGTRVVLISGEAGIGKTRLAGELYEWCIHQGHAAARSRSYAGQGQAAYAPVAELLRSDELRAGWKSLRTQHLAELARLVPEVSEQFPELEKPDSAADVLPEKWQQLFFHQALNSAIAKTRKPTLLYIDDMQWCDIDSLEWLNAFLTTPAAAGVLMLGTLRTEETGRDHPFTRFVNGLRQSGMVLELPLERLSAEETAELVRRESATRLEGENVDEIFRVTRGNPLFVLESVRAGSQSSKGTPGAQPGGGVVRDFISGVPVLSGFLHTPRVHAVISARLAQLSAAAYDLASLASVVGRPFSLELLARAIDWDERSVSDALDELWQRKIIESRGASDYDFSHDLLREVAYSSLSLVRARYLHRRVARALAEIHTAGIENWNGQIARHFQHAGMPHEAIEWLQRAASDARQRYADKEAADLLRNALTLCREFPESQQRFKQELDLMLRLGPVLVTTEGYSATEVGETYDQALDLSRRLQDRSILIALSGAWLFHAVRGNLETSRHIGLEFLERAGQQPDPGLTSAGHFLLGSSLFHLGELAESLRHMSEAARTHTGSAESVLTLFTGGDIGVFCRCYLAHIAWHCGEERQAAAHAAEAISAARQIQHPFSIAIALNYAAILDAFRSERRLALEHATQAVEVCKRHGFAYYLAMANILAGWAQDPVSEALAQIREGLDGMRRLKAELRLPFYFRLLAETFWRAGQIDEALANLSTGFAFATRNGEQWAVAALHLTQGEMLTAEGNREAAETCFLRGLEAARRSGSVNLQQKLSILARGTPENIRAERL
jgi:predicted ATPase